MDLRSLGCGKLECLLDQYVVIRLKRNCFHDKKNRARLVSVRSMIWITQYICQIFSLASLDVHRVSTQLPNAVQPERETANKFILVLRGFRINDNLRTFVNLVFALRVSNLPCLGFSLLYTRTESQPRPCVLFLEENFLAPSLAEASFPLSQVWKI